MWVFIPFLMQSLFCIYYFSIELQHEKYEIKAFRAAAEFIIITTSLYFLWLELLQMKDGQSLTAARIYHHFESSLTNTVEFLSVILNIGLIMNEWTDRYLLGTKWLQFLAILCIFCVWYKVFTWMRLFEKPALFRNSLHS